MTARLRAFFALPLPAELARAVVAAQASLARLGPDLRWLEESKLHLTLKFLGSIAESDVAELAQGLDRIAAGHAPIRALVSGLGAFPLPQRARVLVLRLDDPTGALQELGEAFEALGESVGVGREQRRFQAHVTLARARPLDDVRALIDAFTFPALPASFDRAVLYRSTLQRSGSVYDVLHERRLGGEQDVQS